MPEISAVKKAWQRNEKEIHHLKNNESSLPYGTIEDVLREAALKKMLENPMIGMASKEVRQSNRELIREYNALADLLNTEEQKGKLLDVDAAYNYAAICEAEESFIQGFLMGYRFSKET
ncbi:hypothetical protein JOD45_002206 [Scopulibacillus daqui]|uniref:Uncharacterized protein n=1 Tax=Scopulibacillus daqui TaxID=1469162 RepID=A0ABS2Q1I3_9BACL|nr:hypothetical protein [Scopulibacillus daqui]MBM7645981.1 hypothetical protein [Scopulibacillus daqui]